MDKKICIYGAGKYGLHTYLKLKRANIVADFFADRNKKKSGYAIDGKYCISYDELITMNKDEIIIIMGVNDHLSLIVQFEEIGFREVYRADDFIRGAGCSVNLVSYNPINDIDYLIKVKQILCDVIYNGIYNEQDLEDRELNGIIKDYQIRKKRYEDNGS